MAGRYRSKAGGIGQTIKRHPEGGVSVTKLMNSGAPHGMRGGAQIGTGSRNYLDLLADDEPPPTVPKTKKRRTRKK